MNELGAWVQAQRKSLGWTQEELAARLSVSLSKVNKLERGIHRPVLQTINLLADIFGVNAVALEAFVRGDGGPPVPAPRDELVELRLPAEAHRTFRLIAGETPIPVWLAGLARWLAGQDDATQMMIARQVEKVIGAEKPAVPDRRMRVAAKPTQPPRSKH